VARHRREDAVGRSPRPTTCCSAAGWIIAPWCRSTSAPGQTRALNELAPENTKGDKLSIGYGLAADLKVHSRWRNRRRDHPNPADDGRASEARKTRGQHLMNVAGTPVSVVARAGAPKPDISSVDAFKRTLLTDRSVVYADSANGAISSR